MDTVLREIPAITTLASMQKVPTNIGQMGKEQIQAIER